MAEEQGFAQARARLEEIVGQVRKKDTSLEQSLDLLEEGVRLANQCTELVDHSEWRPSGEPAVEGDGEGDAVTEGVESEVAAHDEASTEVSADTEIPAERRDVDASRGGTDTTGTSGDAAEAEPETGSDDEYDDIFADED